MPPSHATRPPLQATLMHAHATTHQPAQPTCAPEHARAWPFATTADKAATKRCYGARAPPPNIGRACLVATVAFSEGGDPPHHPRGGGRDGRPHRTRRIARRGKWRHKCWANPSRPKRRRRHRRGPRLRRHARVHAHKAGPEAPSAQTLRGREACLAAQPAAPARIGRTRQPPPSRGDCNADRLAERREARCNRGIGGATPTDEANHPATHMRAHSGGTQGAARQFGRYNSLGLSATNFALSRNHRSNNSVAWEWRNAGR